MHTRNNKILAAAIIIFSIALLQVAGIQSAAGSIISVIPYGYNDWYLYGFEKGQFDAEYGHSNDPDYWDNNGSDDYYDGYAKGYDTVILVDWFGNGLSNGRADKNQNYPYQPEAWANDGSENYYVGYSNGYKGTPIDWFRVGWWNGFNDGNGGMIYRPDAWTSNKVQEYYDGYYNGYYNPTSVGSPPASSSNSTTNGNDQSSKPAAVDAIFEVGNPVYSLNGAAGQMDTAPYTSNDRVYVPMRYLGMICGLADADMHWDSATQSVLMQQPEGVTLMFKMGEKSYSINNQSLVMDVAPEASGERVFFARQVCG